MPDNQPNAAQRVIKKFGGAYQLASILGLSPSTVYRWGYGRDGGGHGCQGQIPSEHFPAIIEAAKQEGITLRAKDLVNC